MANNNNNGNKTTLVARIVCGVLAALFVITGAFAIIQALL